MMVFRRTVSSRCHISGHTQNMDRTNENPHLFGIGRALLIVPSQSSSCSVFAGLDEVSRGGDGYEGAPESCEGLFATDLGSLAHPFACIPGRLAVRSLVRWKQMAPERGVTWGVIAFMPPLYFTAGACDCLARSFAHKCSVSIPAR